MAGEGGEVHGHRHLRARRQAAVDLLDLFPDSIRDLEIVGLGLAGDGQAHLVVSIRPEEPPTLVGTFFDAGDVAKAQQVGVRVCGAGRCRQGRRRRPGGGRRGAKGALLPRCCGGRAARTRCRNRQLGEVRWSRIAAGHADGEVLGGGLKGAGGKLEVLGPERGLHVIHSHPSGGHGHWIQPDAHGVDLRAAHPHLGHAGHGGEALDQVAVGVVRKLQPVQRRRGQADEHDRRIVSVRLGDLWRVGLVGQQGSDPADSVPHVVGRVVQVPVKGEGDGDPASPVPRGRVHPVNALDAGDLALDHLGDALLDHLGRRSTVAGRDADRRRIDARKLADRQGQVAGQAHDAKQDSPDRRKDRAADGEV